MEIDLRKLYSLKSLDINEEINIPEEFYKNTDIIRMSPVLLNGRIFINLEDEIELKTTVKGIFILPCAISLEEVSYDFEAEIEQIVGQNLKNNEIHLALLDVLWENIVLEVPIKVVKEGIKTDNLKGDGWEIASE